MKNEQINDDEFKCVNIYLDKILVAMTINDCSYALLSSKTKKFCIPLNAIEGTMTTYVKSGCFLQSNVDTIYHMYFKTMTGLGFELENSVIESQRGDIFFARLYWKNAQKNEQITNTCGAGDAIVLSLMSNSPLKIIKKVLEEVDEFEFDSDDSDFFEPDDFLK